MCDKDVCGRWCETKICVKERWCVTKVVCVTKRRRRRRRRRAEEESGGTDRKTRTPHNDVGKKNDFCPVPVAKIHIHVWFLSIHPIHTNPTRHDEAKKKTVYQSGELLIQQAMFIKECQGSVLGDQIPPPHMANNTRIPYSYTMRKATFSQKNDRENAVPFFLLLNSQHPPAPSSSSTNQVTRHTPPCHRPLQHGWPGPGRGEGSRSVGQVERLPGRQRGGGGGGQDGEERRGAPANHQGPMDS